MGKLFAVHIEGAEILSDFLLSQFFGRKICGMFDRKGLRLLDGGIKRAIERILPKFHFL